MSRIMRDVVTRDRISEGNVVELSTGDVLAVTDAEFVRSEGDWSFLGEDDKGSRRFYSLPESSYHVRYIGEYADATA